MRETVNDRARALKAFPSLLPAVPELEIYETLLKKWQPKINLVGPTTLNALWWRHFADSAQVLLTCPDARTWIDLGSGAGFPGLVVALMLKGRANALVTLVESDSRKAAFLREVSRETSAPVTVLNMRMEQLGEIAPPDAITSRALAPLGRLAPTIRPWIQRGSTGVFLKGESGIEAEEADFQIDSIPSRTGPGFVIKVRSRESGRP